MISLCYVIVLSFEQPNERCSFFFLLINCTKIDSVDKIKYNNIGLIRDTLLQDVWMGDEKFKQLDEISCSFFRYLMAPWDPKIIKIFDNHPIYKVKERSNLN